MNSAWYPILSSTGLSSNHRRVNLKLEWNDFLTFLQSSKISIYMYETEVMFWSFKKSRSMSNLFEMDLYNYMGKEGNSPHPTPMCGFHLCEYVTVWSMRDEACFLFVIVKYLDWGIFPLWSLCSVWGLWWATRGACGRPRWGTTSSSAAPPTGRSRSGTQRRATVSTPCTGIPQRCAVCTCTRKRMYWVTVYPTGCDLSNGPVVIRHELRNLLYSLPGIKTACITSILYPGSKTHISGTPQHATVPHEVYSGSHRDGIEPWIEPKWPSKWIRLPLLSSALPASRPMRFCVTFWLLTRRKWRASGGCRAWQWKNGDFHLCQYWMAEAVL